MSQTIFGAVLFGLIFLRVPFGRPVDSSEVTTFCGALFIVVTHLGLSTTVSVLKTFPSEIQIFRREHFNGMYSTLAYFMSKSFAELPNFVYTPLISAVITYFMFGLNPGTANIFLFYAFITLMVNTCVSFGYMVSAMSPSVDIATMIGPALMMPLLLLGGFFIAVDKVPVYLIWIRYMSWFYYTNELLNINQWADIGDITCDAPAISIPQARMNGTQFDMKICFPNGKSVLNFYGFKEENFGLDLGLLCLFLVVYRLFALIFLYWRVRPSTR